MTLFKICGLRDPDNALAAAEAGADFLGFVFVEGVRRQLQPEQGAEIIQEFRSRLNALSGKLGRTRDSGGSARRTPKIVGLFANQTADFVNSVVRLCDLDYAQLCGDEPPTFWDRLETGVIRQVKVMEDFPRDQAIDLATCRVSEATDAGHLAQLDKYEAGALGGTGKSFDWGLARDIARHSRFLLAGGLTPTNVGEAIGAVSPWGVDVSTGVETDGIKDAAKIMEFAVSVRSASS